MEEEKKMEMKGRVCVTGGTGFLAFWLIKRLLQDGYSVNATIRPSSTPGRNIDYLTSLPGAPERLQVFYADLDSPESFTPAIEGCIGVFHLAHPVDFEGKEAEEVRIRRSVNAVTGILQACLDSKTVKRVVYTSSASTIMVHDKEMVDESSWIDPSPNLMSKQFRGPAVASYALTKMFAEKSAWEFAEKNGLDLVTIIPSFVHGPFFCPFLPGSVQTSMAMIFGLKERYSRLMRTGFVHVEDVARAHIFLFEHPNSSGRYICSATELTFEQLSEFLLNRYPEYPIPTGDSLKDSIIGFKYPGVSSKKLLDMGFQYSYGIEEMFDGAIQSCKQKGFL